MGLPCGQSPGQQVENFLALPSEPLLKVGVWVEGEAWVPSRLVQEDPKEFRAGGS